MHFCRASWLATQTVGDIDVAGGKGTALEGLGAAGDDLGHLDGQLAAFKVGRDKDDGFGGVVEHGLHLVAVIDAGVDVGGQKGRHHKADLRQGVLHDLGVDHVLEHGQTPLVRPVVQDVEAVGAAAIVAVVALGSNRDFAILVEQGRALGRDGQGLEDHQLRDADDDAVGLGPTFDQQVQRLLVVDLHADMLEDLDAGPVDLFALLGAQPRVVGARLSQTLGLDHVSSLCEYWATSRRLEACGRLSYTSTTARAWSRSSMRSWTSSRPTLTR